MESSSFCFCSNNYPNIEAFKRRTCRRSLWVVECLTCWLDINCQDFWWDQDPALNRLFVSTDRQKWAEIFWVAAEVAYQDSGFSCRSWQHKDPSAQTLQCFPFQWRLHVWKSRLKLPVGWSYEFFGQVACWGFQWAHSRMMTSFGLIWIVGTGTFRWSILVLISFAWHFSSVPFPLDPTFVLPGSLGPRSQELKLYRSKFKQTLSFWTRKMRVYGLLSGSGGTDSLWGFWRNFNLVWPTIGGKMRKRVLETLGCRNPSPPGMYKSM